MTDYLPEPEARALVEELAGFRVGVTDLTSLHTVRAFRQSERHGLVLRTFVLGNAGGATGGVEGPTGTERAVCVASGLPHQPHLVVEPDGWLARARALFSREETFARGGGMRVGSREPDAWGAEVPARLLAVAQRQADTGIEVLGELAVVWRERTTASWLLADVVMDVLEVVTAPAD
ncbi:MAG: hypothetical protein H6742_15425 [Alphaproteobacteria bacterium]|nr:hypothetical protein [Alphaproteobacteria bacterium]